MAIRKIIKYPAPSLRAICAPVEFGDNGFRDNWFFKTDFLEHLQDLKDTLAATPDGLAIASNQIRADGWQVFVVRQPSALPEVIINPHWYPGSDTATVSIEGCLSMPGVNARVARKDAVKLEYYDIYGLKLGVRVDGMDAKIVQHEVDHLDGKLIFDYLPKRLQIQARANAIRDRKAGR